MSNLLNIKDLVVRFYTYEGVVKAIEGVNLDVKEGEILGIVGETGCGKTVTGLSIVRLIPPPGKIEGGTIFFKGKNGLVNLLRIDESALKEIRGRDISLIFQEPSSALNPVFTVGEQISEVFMQHRRKEIIEKVLEEIEKDIQKASGRLHIKVLRLQRKIYRKMLEKPNSISLRIVSKIPIVRRYQRRLKAILKKEAIRMLKETGIPDPEKVVDMYPHELSGGMQQRVVIAMALACNPKLLIADEPTTSLDVTVQAQILHLIRDLRKKFKSSILFITHDLGVIAELCDRVAVMYAGNICEIADVEELFKKPLHPYTRALLESIPRPGKELKSIPGTVPNLISPPSGCRFHPRCPYIMQICSKVKPEMKQVTENHFVACHLY